MTTHLNLADPDLKNPLLVAQVRRYLAQLLVIAIARRNMQQDDLLLLSDADAMYLIQCELEDSDGIPFAPQLIAHDLLDDLSDAEKASIRRWQSRDTCIG